MTWISVKEQAPRKDIPILVWYEFLDFPVSVHWLEEGTYGDCDFFMLGDEYSIDYHKITHWMPLPEPPNE